MTERPAPTPTPPAGPAKPAKPAKPARRKAWTYIREEAPGLSDLLAGGARRKRFWKWWLWDSLDDAGDLAVHFGLKLLPMDAASDLGAWLSRRAMRRNPRKVRIMRANLRRIRPDLDDAAREEIVRRNIDAQGRVLTEFSHINGLSEGPDRLMVHGLAEAMAEAEGRPVIMLGMHIGNWEVGSVAVAPYRKAFTVNVPPPRRARAWIAERVRTKARMGLVPPGRQGAREALRLLRQSQGVVFFCDEAFRNEIRGPFFDRPLHLEGNFAVVARLARATNARICPWYLRRRDDGFRFDFRILPSFDLPPETVRGDRLIEDVALLNSVIEPVIKANLDQWYFLDNHLPGAPGKRKRGKGVVRGAGKGGPAAPPRRGEQAAET